MPPITSSGSFPVTSKMTVRPMAAPKATPTLMARTFLAKDHFVQAQYCSRYTLEKEIIIK